MPSRTASVPPAKKRILLFSAAAVLLAACLALLLLLPQSPISLTANRQSEKAYRNTLARTAVDVFTQASVAYGILDSVEQDISMVGEDGSTYNTDYDTLLQQTVKKTHWWLTDRVSSGLPNVLKAHGKVVAEMRAVRNRVGYEQTFSLLQKMYAGYTTIYRQATNPKGSKDEFISLNHKTQSDISSAYYKLEKLLPEIKENVG